MARTTHKSKTIENKNYDEQEVESLLVNIPKEDLSDKEIEKLTDMVMAFVYEMTGVALYPYQQEFGWRIIYSLLLEDSEELTGLFARQMGKTHVCASVTVTAMVLFPILAKYITWDERISKFKDGFKIGIYAPTYGQVGLLWNRMKDCLYTDRAKTVLLDPDIDMDLETEKRNLVLSNGSRVHAGTASPQSNIEGHTHHAIIIDECLGAESVVETSIGPMRIKDLVESEYSGFVLSWDHEKEKVVWAKVEGLLKRPSSNPCYRLEFEDNTVHECTGEHPWYIDGVGYVKTRKIFSFHSSETPVRLHELQSDRKEGAGLFHLRKEVFSEKNSSEKTILFLRMQEGKQKAVRLKKIEKIPPLEEVFDIKTSQNNFFASGILSHNTQDVSSVKIKASIHPMLSATAGSIVKIGTPNRKRTEFYDACRRNKRVDLAEGLTRSKFRRHFEFDYTVGQKYNKRYRKYVSKETYRLGEDSDEFRMKYRLHWLLDRGMFVNPEIFSECGITSSSQSVIIEKGKGKRSQKIIFTRPMNVVTYNPTGTGQIASIDVGRTNSTVVTIGKVFWDNPILYGGDYRYHVHIMNWLELYGDDHEAQHPQIVDFLKNYLLEQAIVDATGKGDPVYSRLAADLEGYGVYVQPFIFNEKSKDIGYKVLGQEISSKRLSYPAGARTTRLQKYQRFVGQMEDLEKEWRGQKLVVHKPNTSDARDDFCDSLMMLCWLANVRGTMEVEEAPNPFLGRRARWVAAEAMQGAKAWYKNVFEPSVRQNRSSKRGRWD